MKIDKILLFLLFVIVSTFCACYYDNEEDLYPPMNVVSCDTSGVAFNKTILPVLNNYCNNCHSEMSASSLGGNIILSDYTSVKKYCGNGSLYGSIVHSSAYSPMPAAGNKLDECTVLQVKSWIDKGAKND